MADGMTIPGSGSPGWKGERALRVLIPVGSLALATLLVAVGLASAPEAGAQGFQLEAEITKTCFGLAASLVTLGFVSFLISEYWRGTDQRRELEARRRAGEESARAERRRLVGELRSVHHDVKTSQLRMKAHRSIRTYGEEMRDVVMPAVAQLGGVISDINADSALLASARRAEVVARLGTVATYLRSLTEEFERRYLTASRLQEADHEWRQQRMLAVVREERFSQAPPGLSDLPDPHGWLWNDYVQGVRPDGAPEFPALAILLEDSTKHADRFSKPLREAIEFIEGTKPSQQ
jgi:hypothetical protein